MFETLRKTGSFVVLPVREGGRWVTNEEYAVFLPVDMLHLTEMMMASGEYEYKSDEESRGKFLRDSFPDMGNVFVSKDLMSKAEIEDTNTSIKRPDTGDVIQAIKVSCPTRTKIYGKKGDAMFQKDMLEKILEIHPEVDLYLGDRLTPLTFIKSGSEYSLENSVAFLAEVVSWD
jgi:hypothetical protein